MRAVKKRKKAERVNFILPLYKGEREKKKKTYSDCPPSTRSVLPVI